MNYKKYFQFEPGKATCREENCPRKLVYRKQGNTTGMRFHLKKYHSDLWEKDSQKELAENSGFALSLSSLIQNSDIPTESPIYPINFGSVKAESSSSDNHFGYHENIDDEVGLAVPGNEQFHDNPSGSTNYDGKAQLMDILFNTLDNREQNDNNLQNHFNEHQNEAPIPKKRQRTNFVQNSATVFDYFYPFPIFLMQRLIQLCTF
uniref:BED-type domain-containing protein n=1 Tax=Panagrolaimus davidi TaxID=227884 RepID=A0A914QV71_9BILA